MTREYLRRFSHAFHPTLPYWLAARGTWRVLCGTGALWHACWAVMHACHTVKSLGFCGRIVGELGAMFIVVLVAGWPVVLPIVTRSYYWFFLAGPMGFGLVLYAIQVLLCPLLSWNCLSYSLILFCICFIYIDLASAHCLAHGRCMGVRSPVSRRLIRGGRRRLGCARRG